MIKEISKVLIIGSGPIVIGQAAEFDYAGTQACKSLKEEGVEVVLVNSNPATIMTDLDVADKVYIEPLIPEIIEKIIIEENPDGILGTLGGQTGLNLVMELDELGILKKYNVKVLGTSISSIKMAEDRDEFRILMNKLYEPVPKSFACSSIQESLDAAEEIGYPVVVRPAYTLGGSGGGVAKNQGMLETIADSGLKASRVNQVLIEESLVGWKEVEYEVIRDSFDNAITICNMENIDPLGVHTGDSIVVAPSQTLTDKDYQLLRSASLKIIRALSIEGGCNIQFALEPYWISESNKGKLIRKQRYYVIEVNPRVSRSSALASKATGYPIARIAAKIALGKKLDDMTNVVTRKTTAAFEPSLDYCVVKIPRWPFDKFESGDRTIGTQMKATGEVMAIDRTFESAFLKALRSLDVKNQSQLSEFNELGENFNLTPSDSRIWRVMNALRKGMRPIDLSTQTGFDPWFSNSFLKIINMEKELSSNDIDSNILRRVKRMGFADSDIAEILKITTEEVRNKRIEFGIIPTYKMVDTCAAEFEAFTPYFYSTYETENEALPIHKDKVIVLGSGPIRIGQGIEFDYCSVHAAWALDKINKKSIMINSNPETVSTDFDTSERLYFEPLDEESIRNIIDNESYGSEKPKSIVQFGGQTAVNLATSLDDSNNPIMGSSAKTIDNASDRISFEKLTESLKIPQPPGGEVSNVTEAINVANSVGFPVVVRPSYVLGGMSMEILQNTEELKQYFESHSSLFQNFRGSLLIDRYIEGIEVEVDAVCDGQNILIPGIMEHIERAGVHSGDSIAVYPPINLTKKEIDIIVKHTKDIGVALEIKGLMNIQFVIKRSETREDQDVESKVYILELNPRSSRTIPFISKVTGIPMIDIAVKIMNGTLLNDLGYVHQLVPNKNFYAVKAPVFSMSKLTGVDTFLGPEMKSTGEVMGIDDDFQSALSKALISSQLQLPPEGKLILSIADRDKMSSKKLIKLINFKGYKFAATPGTADLIESLGFSSERIEKVLSRHPNAVDLIEDKSIIGVINTVTGDRKTLQDGFHIRRIATERKIPCFTSLDTAYAAVDSSSVSTNLQVKSLEKFVSF
jgi:carbamoyl-phosphate synthase large subunit